MSGSFIDMQTVEYRDGDTVCEGVVALPDTSGRSPAVLIVHQWAGLGAQERETAERLASSHGYVGFAVDVYGKGVRGSPSADNSHLLQPWFGDRAALLKRLTAAIDFAKGHPAVDPDRIAMMGYCFGGLCVLDVARSGTGDVKGVVSLHGIFAKPGLGEQGPIASKVLVLHGYDDPMAKPDDMVGLADELTAAGADWQIHAYGNTTHAFTAKHANDKAGGKAYNADADRRSWASTVAFFEEVLA